MRIDLFKQLIELDKKVKNEYDVISVNEFRGKHYFQVRLSFFTDGFVAPSLKIRDLQESIYPYELVAEIEGIEFLACVTQEEVEKNYPTLLKELLASERVS
jgi:hypothetical protein